MAQVRVNPIGVMDKDTEISYVNKGNYTDALNIRKRGVDSNGNDFGGVVAIKGNSIALNTVNGVSGTSLSYLAETQTYRIYVDVEDIYKGSISSHDATIYVEDSSGVLHTKSTGPSVNYASTNLAGAISVIKSDLNNILNTWLGGLFTYSATTVTKTISGTDVAGYFDVTTSLTNEFTFLITNNQGEYANFVLISEYHSEVGDFSVIGSIQLEEELYVLLAGDDLNADGTSVISEIGVIFPNSTGYSYTKLVRSKKLKFHPERKAEMQIERNGPQINIYWTDNLNPPRVVYLKYKNRKTINGILNITEGRYDLSNIDFESLFFLPSETSYFEDIKIIEGKGRVKAGNKRYTGRFLTDDFVYQDYIEITNPFPIYLATSEKPYEISGNPTNELTNKGVELKVKNFTPGIYKYFELIVIEYKGFTFDASIVQRFTLTGNETELLVEHTEIGQELIKISSEELLSITSKYIAVKNLTQYDNRMVLSNLKEQVDFDLTNWANKIQHSIEETYITGVGNLKNVAGSVPKIGYGEYAVPENVRDYTGYMINDTYRFGIQVQWKNTGKWSNAYWLDDIRFDGSSTNVNTSDNRRKVFGGLVSSINTTTDTITVNNHSFYEGQKIVFSGTTPPSPLSFNTIYYAINVTNNTFQVSQDPNPTVVIDLTTTGTSVSVTKKKIDNNLAEGTSELDNRVKVFYPKFYNIDLDYLVDTNLDGISDTPLRKLIKAFKIVRSERIPEVLFTGLFSSNARIIQPDGSYLYYPQFSDDTYGSPSGVTGATRQILTLISSDLNYGENYDYQIGDKIKLIGSFSSSGRFTYTGRSYTSPPSGTLSTYRSKFTTTNGYFSDPMVYDAQYAEYVISEHFFVGTDSTLQKGTNYYTTSVGIETVVFLDGFLRSSNIFKIDTTISYPASLTDTGLYYGQLFRDLGGNLKYPKNKELSFYQSIGHLHIVNETDSGAINGEVVFGGDVFNQRSYLRVGFTKYLDSKVYGTGISFYSQNTRNSQLQIVREHDDTFGGPGNNFPQLIDKTKIGSAPTVDSGDWRAGLFYWLEQWVEVTNQNEYDQSYSANYQAVDIQSFNINDFFDGSSPVKIVWSAKKVTGTLKDSYRVFKPLDFAELDLTKGEIVHHEVVNNSFYTLQEFSVQRQYFRDAALLGAQQGTDIVVGSGSILGAPGTELTSIGTSKKESVVKGKNPNGKDTLYWYNDRLQKLVRLAGDGINVISDRALSTFLLNNGKYISNEFYPLSGKGVHGVWNDRYGELILTFKYNDGVSNKAFTLVYDELANGFLTFHSYAPNIYLPYNNTFFSPNPSVKNTIYIHDENSNTIFYGISYDSYIEMVMNYDPNMSKIFEAVQVNSEEVPTNGPQIKAMTFETSNHISFLDTSDFELREDFYYSTIKNDSTGTGINTNDTSRLFGRWLKFRVNLTNASKLQKLINVIVKFRPSPRLYN